VGAAGDVASGPFADTVYAGIALPSPVAHVRADAGVGGDGSPTRPFATLAEAVRAGAATVLLARGEHGVAETIVVGRDLTLVGVGASTLRPPAVGPTLRVRGVALSLARLTLRGATDDAPVVDVAEGATASLRHVVVDGGAAGLRVSGASTQAALERVTVVRTRVAGVVVEDGARARLVGVSVRDGGGLGVIAGASAPGLPGGRLLLRDSLVARNWAEGVTLTRDGGDATGFQACDDTLSAPRGAFDCVASTAVQDNRATGVYVAGARRVTGRALVVSGTRARGGIPSGDGLFVGDGASLSLDLAVVGDARMGHGSQWVGNARAAVLLSGAGATLSLHGARIRDNASVGVFVQRGATLEALRYSALERNGGAALAASEGATLGSILCDHFLATRPALLVTTAGRVTLADGASIHRATVREMTGNELSSNGRFGLILNAASGALTRNRGAGNLFGLGNYAPAGVTVDDAAAIRGRSPPPAALPAVALDP
jgi:hypothetical protein